MKEQVIPKSKRCGVLDCGREEHKSLICDWTLLNNRAARIAAFRARALNGSKFLCCEACRKKYERTTGVIFESMEVVG